MFNREICNYKEYYKFSLEDNISIHAYVYIEASGGIEIRNDISIANHTTIVSLNIPGMKKIIKNDVWIGSGCRILSGVTINSRSIVVAGPNSYKRSSF